MHENIIHLNEEAIKGQLSQLVRGTVEETLNKLLDEEADRMGQSLFLCDCKVRVPVLSSHKKAR